LQFLNVIFNTVFECYHKTIQGRFSISDWHCPFLWCIHDCKIKPPS